MVDIQSGTVVNRLGKMIERKKKKVERRKKKPQVKNIMACLLHRAAIKNRSCWSHE